MSHASFLLLPSWALFVKKWSPWTTMMICEFGDPIILLYLAVKLAHSFDALGNRRCREVDFIARSQYARRLGDIL